MKKVVNIDFEAMKKFCEENYEKCFGEEGSDDSSGMMGFEFDEIHIINPFITECGRFDVEPVEYYGKAFLQSEFCKNF